MSLSPPSAEALRAAFDGVRPLTVGLEEELMLLDPDSCELTPVAPQALELLGGDGRFKGELPASQLEIVTPPAPSVQEALALLADGRRDLAAALGRIARPAATGLHPTSPEEGPLNRGERYDRTAREHGIVARRQLLCALQVHVAVGGADRTLAVYEALRPLLPEIAALAANAPYHAGRDTGLASMRPLVGGQLPRQGLPPPIASWEHFAEELRWGATAGAVPEPGVWWWELRPHVAFGTLEVRVPDAQTTVREAGAVAAFVHALVAHLAERHDAGEGARPVPTWRIAENRWAALRHGVEGTLADVRTGRRRPTRERLTELIDAIAPAAARVGCALELEDARRLVEANGAMRQRAVAAKGGIAAVPRWLAERFLAL